MRMSTPSNHIEPTRWFCVAVKEPVAVRYAWADNPVCTLCNRAGLPASPFRTNDWPVYTTGKR